MLAEDRLQEIVLKYHRATVADEAEVMRALPQLAEVVTAARALYEQVQEAESVGVCLDDRVPCLALGQALLELDQKLERRN